MKHRTAYPELDTPSILVDLDKLDTNIAEMAYITAQAGLKLRPNTKVHRSIYVADLQINSGAIGVSVSKPGEAAVFVRAGVEDIMIVHPFFGDHKLNLLSSLLGKARISCVVDSIIGAEQIARVGKATNMDIPVLIKINTNCNRFGVSLGNPSLEFARKLNKIKGIELVGILTHESSSGVTTSEGIESVAYETASLMSETAHVLKADGIGITDVILGSTPTARNLCQYKRDFPELTEIHPGAYVFGDLIYVKSLSMEVASCAATVLVTVNSTPEPQRACTDGGYKTFGADPILPALSELSEHSEWRPSFGVVVGRPDLEIRRLTEEIGILTVTDPNNGVEIGDRLEILPNHISLTVNLHEKMYGVRGGIVEREIQVTARGIDY